MKRKNHKLTTYVVFFILLIFMYFIICYFYYNYIDIGSKNYETDLLDSTVYVQTVDETISGSSSIADMIEISSESVVGISKLKDISSSIFSKNIDTNIGLGTGIIISNTGYILSNSHVTGEKYSSCYITLNNGNSYYSTVLWSDTDLDLSICKINVTGLKPAMLGDSSLIRPGETIFAIGNPIGYEFRKTVTSGIISAINRTIKIEDENNQAYMTDLIQTDATINPGNSGGPLLNASGQVIGITTVKISSADGIGFAVPINVVKPVIEKFIKNNSFNEAYIGILAYDSNVIPYLTSSPSYFKNGIYISQIDSTGPASNVDLKIGDIIHSIDGIELKTMNDLKNYIYKKDPGDNVKISFYRGKIRKEINLTLGKR